MIANLASDSLPNSFLADVLLTGLGSPTLLSVAGSRMFLNLKEAAEHGVNIGTNLSSYSHSAIRFDEPGPQNGEILSSSLVFKLSSAHRSDVSAIQFGEQSGQQ